MEVSSSMVEFPSATARRKTAGFLSNPKSVGKHPAVIVIHEIFGLVDHIKDVAMRLAKEGYTTLAIDLFEGKTLTQLEEGRKFREQFTQERMLADLNSGHSYLKTLKSVNPDRIGSIGFCMGGGLSMLLACQSREIAATAVFYGRNPTPLDLVKNLQCPILGNYAGADLAISEADIKLLEETLTKYGKIFDIKTYPGAPHGFFNDSRQSYRPDAAKDSWKRTINFFGKYLKT